MATAMKTHRTSIDSPLIIHSVQVPNGNGMIGMSLCMGKNDEDYLLGPWKRNIEADLKVVLEWGASAVVSLMEDYEFECLGVPELEQKIKKIGLDWYHLPIQDECQPGLHFENSWKEIGPVLHKILDDGGKFLLFCREGLGRSGTVTAKILIERGMSVDEAIESVREARAGSIENFDQEDYLFKLGNVVR